jgi:uncharacterized membrane protein (UPF0182 family)
LVAQFPGQNSARFQLTAAVVPRARGNLAALLSASYVDGKPTFQILELPADTAVPGPEQVHGNMTSIPQARQELTQFTSQNSDVIYGNLLSLPVGNGFLYVEPLYLKTKGDNSYPFLRKVLVAYQKYVAYADDLTSGLQSLVQQATGQTGNPPPTTGNPPPTTGNPPNAGAVGDAIAAMDKALADLKAAQASGNFEAYGKALQALTDAINRYNQARAAQNATPNPSGSASPAPSASGSPAAPGTPTPAG